MSDMRPIATTVSTLQGFNITFSASVPTISLFFALMGQMNKLLLLLLLCTCALGACTPDVMTQDHVPSFDTTYVVAGQQQAHGLLADDSGLLIVGTTEEGGQSRILMMRLDLNGQLIWQHELNTQHNAEGHGLIRSGDGNLIVIGSQLSNGDKNMLLVKTDFQGTVLWEREFGGPYNDIGRDVIALQEGDLMLIGTTSSFGDGVADMFAVRTDNEGTAMWSRAFGGPSLDGGSELIQTGPYTVMMLGFAESFGSGYRDQWLLEISLDGDSLWSSTYGGAAYEESQALVRASNGDLILCGHSASIDPVHAMHGLRIGMDRAMLWEQHFGTVGLHEGGEAALEDGEGNLLFAGRGDVALMGEDIFLVRTDASGNILAQQQFGGEGNQWATDLAEHTDAYFILGNSVQDGDMNILLIKQAK